MKLSNGLNANGIVVGNNFNKYESKNPIVQLIIKKFDNDLTELVTKANPTSIHEVGCGEGYWVLKWLKNNINAKGSDFSPEVIDIARENALAAKVSTATFFTKSIYDINQKEDSADLIVCCEVMEHLETPSKAFAALQRTVTKYLILSVPREPLWRILNLVRFKYVIDGGNTPGHIQHWSSKSFIQLTEKYFKIVDIKTPLPWTMLLCKKK